MDDDGCQHRKTSFFGSGESGLGRGSQHFFPLQVKSGYGVPAPTTGKIHVRAMGWPGTLGCAGIGGMQEAGDAEGQIGSARS